MFGRQIYGDFSALRLSSLPVNDSGEKQLKKALENIIMYNIVMQLCIKEVSMTRTTIVLPENIKSIAVKNAQAEGISFGEFVRKSLEASIRVKSKENKIYSRKHDSLFSGMKRLARSTKPGVIDASVNHDKYLYD